MTNYEKIKAMLPSELAKYIAHEDEIVTAYCNSRYCGYCREDGTCTHHDGGCEAAALCWLNSESEVK